MGSKTRRFSCLALAAALAAGPAFAQVTPDNSINSTVGGVPPTTAPSNDGGAPAASTPRHSAPRHRAHRVRHRAHRAARPAVTPASSAAGPDGSDAPSR